MIIKGLNIFLTWNQYRSLMTNEVCEKINELPSIDPTNINKVLNQKNKILFDEVEERFRNKKNAIEFLNSWMKFDIVDEEAKENTWNILNDYCSKNDYSYLRDKRSLDDQLTSEILGDSYSYFPMSKTFSLIHNIPEKKNWFGKRIQNSAEIEILFDADKVIRIEGEFKYLFKIHTSDFEYIFGAGLSIIPVDK